MLKTLCAILLLFGLSALVSPRSSAQAITLEGLRTSAGNGSFEAAQYASDGSLILLFDQGDGLRLLKTNASATIITAQVHLGAAGDDGIALAQDATGNIYVTGTSSSGTLNGTAAALYPAPADASVNAFLARFDPDLNLNFLTFLGAGRTVPAAVAVTSDAVFVTGTTYNSAFPVTASALQQTASVPTAGVGFVQRFTTDGSTLVYSTYLGGSSGGTIPNGLAVDATDSAYIAGQTSATGFPTSPTAIQSQMLGTTSGFLSKLSAGGDALAFSTFIPGAGLTSLSFDPTSNTLLATGNIALGDFPVTAATAPIANTPYQSLLRLSADGQSVLSCIPLAPGTASYVTAALNKTAWISIASSVPPLSFNLPGAGAIGDSALLHIAANGLPDSFFRIGGLPIANAAYATLATTPGPPASSSDGASATVPGTLSATVASTLFASQTFDLPSTAPTSVLPNAVTDLTSAACTTTGSCSTSAGLLASVTTNNSGPTLELSTGNAPNLTLRNQGSTTATGIVIAATGYTVETNCTSTLAPTAQCGIVLNGSGPGTLTVSASNAPQLTTTSPLPAQQPQSLILSADELDFGIVAGSSPITRTVTVTNLSTRTQTFTSTLDSGPQNAPYSLGETSSTCTGTAPNHSVPANSTCAVTFALAASPDASDDGPVSASWKINSQDILLTGITQSAALSLSASQIDFGVHLLGLTPALPRFLYISNSSGTAVQHTPVTLPGNSPFTVTDRCPDTLAAHSVCQIEIDYTQTTAPADDSATLTVDGFTALVTAVTLPATSANSANLSIATTPTSATFAQPVVVTAVSSEVQALTLTNTGAAPLSIALSITGDFTQTNNCGPTLGPGASCVALLHFTPSEPGIRDGLLAINTGATAPSLYVPLSGTASNLLALSNGSINLGQTYLGEPVVAWYRVQSSVPLLTASATGAGFSTAIAADQNDTHPTLPSSAFSSSATAACAGCWIGVQFLPQQAGSAAGTLTLATAAGGRPYIVALTADSVPIQGLVLTPGSQDFGSVSVGSNSAPVTFTLANLTAPAQPVTIQSASATGDFALLPLDPALPSCTGTLAYTASCLLQISFTPTLAGTRVGSLTITTSQGTVTASLVGSAQAASTLLITPAALSFSNQPGAAATQGSLTLTNTTNSSVAIGAPAASSAQFAVTSSCATLGPGQSCMITVTFSPGSAQTSATLTIPVTTNNGQPPTASYTVPLTGTYTTGNVGLVLVPAQVNFGSENADSLGQTRQFTIINTSQSPQTIIVQAPRNFPLSTPFNCSSLAAGASCTFSATFLPQEVGALTGSLVLNGTPSSGTSSQAIAYLQGFATGSGSLTLGGTQSLTFPQLTSGQIASQTVTVTNNGLVPVNLRRLTTAAPFSSSSNCNGALAPAATCSFTVTYEPTDEVPTSTTSLIPRTDTGTLNFESDASTSPNILSLTGSVLPVTVPTASAQPYAGYTLSSSALTFQTTAGQPSATQAITVINTGTSPITFGNLAATAGFTSTSDCATLQPSATCTVQLAFSPGATATTELTTGVLQLPSNAPNALDFVTLLGLPTAPILTATPSTVNFGAVDAGSSAQQTLTLTNNGPLPLVLSQPSISGPYTIVGDTCPTATSNLPPGQSCTLAILFSPHSSGTQTGSLIIPTQAGSATLTVPLTGSAAAPRLQASVTAIAFGSQDLGLSTTLPLTLSNLGNAAATGLKITITGTNPADFTISASCGQDSLAPAAFCTLQIAFRPAAVGSRTASLTLTSSDPSSPMVISLTGTGIQPTSFDLTVNGARSATATISAGGTASYAALLTAVGGYTGPVALTCAPVSAAPYSTCSANAATLTLNGNSQPATVTITTSTAFSTVAESPLGVLLLTPLLLIRRRLPRARHLLLTVAVGLSLTTITGCGGPGNTGQHLTPPGSYQFQVTARSVSGTPVSSTATLNLVIQ